MLNAKGQPVGSVAVARKVREVRMLELYHHGTSVCAAKIRIALAEKALDWTGHYIDILAGDQLKPEYLKINPKGVVPTLVHDGHIVRESTVIGEYLDDALPDRPLKPAAALDRAAMRMWTKRLDEDVHQATAIVTFAVSHRHAVLANPPEMVDEYINKFGPDEAVRRRARLERGIDSAEAAPAIKTYDKFLADMEAALAAGGPWLAGKTFSLAETGVIPYVNRLDMLQLSGMWTERRPRLTDWWTRVKARPWFEREMLSYAPAPLRALMKAKGDEAWPQVKAILAA